MAQVTERLSSSYNIIFNDLADPRVKDWAFMSDPGLILIMTALYTYFVTSLGPNLMEKRKPFKLKNTIIIYNTFQVVANTVLFYKIYTSGWSTTLSLGCEPVDYSDEPNAVSLVESFWWYLLLKILELIETVFFVLRKKQNQVSFLHVYHHVSTLGFAWIGAKYIGGGMSSFCVMLNTFIHIIMYMYYLLAALADENLQRFLSKWKKYLTAAQMIQMFVVVIHLLQAMSPKCPLPKGIIVIFLPNVVIVLSLFYNFYNRSYKKHK
ncbi:very long chain fatty acid elongase AAEL008004-like [Lycorma delicatula]|uniref:very long chain fatty acid elongase AAEL008004-like n=1 Tax=Lycorma delicatula TaxID=130591 RepID=UPI003F5127DF